MNILQKIAAQWNIFPCPVCGGDGDGGNAICPECRQYLRPIAGSRCRGCGGTLDGMFAVCSKCMQEELRPWVCALAAMEYTGLGRDLIHHLKFRNNPELARPLSRLAIPLLRECGEPCDVLVPIPLHYRRMWSRTYNQSRLVAELCASAMGVPCVNALRRVKNTPHQAGLNRKMRLKNIRNAFTVCKSESIAGKNVWLVDDVFTTGTTLTEAAKTLLAAGSGPVRVLVLARA